MRQHDHFLDMQFEFWRIACFAKRVATER